MTGPRTPRVRAVAAVGSLGLVVSGLLNGCVATADDSMLCGQVEESLALAETAAGLPRGEQVPLADLTDFDWDRVWYFSGADDLATMRAEMRVTSTGPDFGGRSVCAFHGLYFVAGDQLVQVLNWADNDYRIVFGDRGSSWDRSVMFLGGGTFATLCTPADCPPESTD